MMTEIFVATHRKVSLRLPPFYHLIQVGAAFHDRIDGCEYTDLWGQDNIAVKNESYSELTALYCLWKHSKADIKGLFHYRRLFYDGEPTQRNIFCYMKRAGEIAGSCISEESIERYLNEYDVIDEIPLNSWPHTVEENMLRYCYPEDLMKLERIIQESYPDYLATYRRVMSSKHASFCNLMIAGREIFDNYCSWLFEVLAKCEAEIDISRYDQQHKRVYGYFSEVLMNVWIQKNNLREKYVPRLDVFEYNIGKDERFYRKLYRRRFVEALSKLNIQLPFKVYRVQTEQIRAFRANHPF